MCGLAGYRTTRTSDFKFVVGQWTLETLILPVRSFFNSFTFSVFRLYFFLFTVLEISVYHAWQNEFVKIAKNSCNAQFVQRTIPEETLAIVIFTEHIFAGINYL